MHITDASRGILGMNGIIGPQYLFAAGAAYSAKVRGTAGGGRLRRRQVGQQWLVLFRSAQRGPLQAAGDRGGREQWLPDLDAAAARNSLINLHNFGAGLEIPHEAVNGMDAMAVYTVAQRAVERARAGGGPTLIETKTYRYYDHAGLAGAKPGVLGAFGLPYRSDSEVRAWIAEDPIPRMRRQLVANSIITEEEADATEAELKQLVAASIDAARAAAHPKQDAALGHVFANALVKPSQFIA